MRLNINNKKIKHHLNQMYRLIWHIIIIINIHRRVLNSVTAGQRRPHSGSVVSSLMVEGQRPGVSEWQPALHRVARPAEPWADHGGQLLAGVPVHRNTALHRPAPDICECHLHHHHHHQNKPPWCVLTCLPTASWSFRGRATVCSHQWFMPHNCELFVNST